MNKITDKKLEIIIKKAFNCIAESDVKKLDDISSSFLYYNLFSKLPWISIS